MVVRSVHWHGGMFLRPHLFQAAQRHIQCLTHESEKWDHHYGWGLRAAEIDLDALANSRLVIRSLKARLRDGTLVSIPEDGTLPNLDDKTLKAAFETHSNLTVFLAVLVASVGKANVGRNGSANGARYLLDEQPLEEACPARSTVAVRSAMVVFRNRLPPLGRSFSSRPTRCGLRPPILPWIFYRSAASNRAMLCR